MSDWETPAALREKRFRPSTPQVAAQIIEGEAIIVNLRTGTYYSLVDAGAEVWAGIEARSPIGNLIDHLARRYGTSLDVVETATAHLVEHLSAEGLIEPYDDSAVEVDTLPAEFSTRTSHEFAQPLKGFVPPTLEKFDDMADLILLDPIHDVGEAGWPHPKDDLPRQE